MKARYIVELSPSERASLQAMVSSGKGMARDLKRAQVLLASSSGMVDEAVARALSVSVTTIFRTKRRFVLEGVEAAIRDRSRPGAARKLTGKEEAILIATACSTPPAGRARWTLELLAGEVMRLTGREVSRETARRRLAENELKPWKEKMWCIPQVDGEFVARMEDVLDLYAETPPKDAPVVCFDESPLQLLAETRERVPAGPGRPARVDYEYRRMGTANLFVFVDAHAPWRHVKVTEQRTRSTSRSA